MTIRGASRHTIHLAASAARECGAYVRSQPTGVVARSGGAAQTARRTGRCARRGARSDAVTRAILTRTHTSPAAPRHPIVDKTKNGSKLNVVFGN